MDERLERAEWIEREAWDDVMTSAPGLGARRLGEALVLRAPGLDHPMLNRTLFARRPDEETIDAALATHTEDGVRRFFVHGLHGPDEAWLERALVARGLARYRRSWVKLARGRGPVLDAQTDLTLREARREDAGAIGALVTAGFDMPAAAGIVWGAAIGRPGWHALVACEGDVVAATGLLFVRDGTGYLAGAATSPAFRRRGAQGALVAARISRALELGCELVISETGEAVPGDPQSSYRNLERFGLGAIGTRANYALPAVTFGPPRESA